MDVCRLSACFADGLHDGEVLLRHCRIGPLGALMGPSEGGSVACEEFSVDESKVISVGQIARLDETSVSSPFFSSVSVVGDNIRSNASVGVKRGYVAFDERACYKARVNPGGVVITNLVGAVSNLSGSWEDGSLAEITDGQFSQGWETDGWDVDFHLNALATGSCCGSAGLMDESLFLVGSGLRSCSGDSTFVSDASNWGPGFAEALNTCGGNEEGFWLNMIMHLQLAGLECRDNLPVFSSAKEIADSLRGLADQLKVCKSRMLAEAESKKRHRMCFDGLVSQSEGITSSLGRLRCELDRVEQDLTRVRGSVDSPHTAAEDLDEVLGLHRELQEQHRLFRREIGELTGACQTAEEQVRRAGEVHHEADILRRRARDLRAQLGVLQVSESASNGEGGCAGNRGQIGSSEALFEDAQRRLDGVRLSALAQGDNPGGGLPPHLTLRMKCGNSAVKDLQSEIAKLERIISDGSSRLDSIELDEAELFDFGTDAAEQSNASEVRNLQCKLDGLKGVQRDHAKTVESAFARHLKSIGNFQSRLEGIATQLSILSRPEGVQDAQPRGHAGELGTAVQDAARLVAGVDATLRGLEERLDMLRGLRGKAVGGDLKETHVVLGVEDLKRQIEGSKQSNLNLEAELSAAKMKLGVLSARQREREERLVAGKIRETDDGRVHRLQQEVDRRDLLITRLRQECLRLKQLEAKLISTKTNVNVQKQNHAQDAQLAAARSLAQGRQDDMLVFVKSAARRISKNM